MHVFIWARQDSSYDQERSRVSVSLYSEVDSNTGESEW